MLVFRLDLLWQSRGRRQELESGQGHEQEAVAEQQPRSTNSSLGLPPPVRMGKELDFGEPAAVGRSTFNAGRNSISNTGSGGDNANSGVWVGLDNLGTMQEKDEDNDWRLADVGAGSKSASKTAAIAQFFPSSPNDDDKCPIGSFGP